MSRDVKTSSKIREIKISSASGKGGHAQPPRFTWHTSRGNSSTTFQPKHQQPLRFFGTTNHPWFPDRKDSVRDDMVRWENTFNMRAYNLNQITGPTNYRPTYRSQTIAVQRARLGFVSGTTKSLDILRQNLQKSINKEIDDVLQKYLKKFFKLAVENIKRNNGEQAVSEQHIQTVCQQILEEAKKMYQVNIITNPTPVTEAVETENVIPEPPKLTRPTKNVTRKRKDSDTDSDVSLGIAKPKKKKKGRPPKHYQGSASSGSSTPLKVKADHVKREGPKWEPNRLTLDTQFIMGAKANKALGLGATRGRLYIKHKDVFKYSGDQEDKQWLYDHNLMPATGGKAYMLLVNDIQELADSDEYRNNPLLLPNEIIGFTVPESMLSKMKKAMRQMRSTTPVKKRGRPTGVEISSVGKSNRSQTVTPTDDTDLLSSDLPSTDRSPFYLSTGFDDIGSTQADISPAPSDLSSTLEPPLTAPFDMTSTP